MEKNLTPLSQLVKATHSHLRSKAEIRILIYIFDINQYSSILMDFKFA